MDGRTSSPRIADLPASRLLTNYAALGMEAPAQSRQTRRSAGGLTFTQQAIIELDALTCMCQSGGLRRMRTLDVSGVEFLNHHGQALAARTVGFEGARDCMYAIDRKAFEWQITSLLDGEEYDLPKPRNGRAITAVAYPACPPH
ncbi:MULTISPECIES: hypothetical protein [Bradyrhizobium]|uniref:Uncharacterized protein n=4 Tax=Bradyrhizobium TaxID=374 RepID=A0A974AGZ8_9BRAD|nr:MULTISPECIES: hypothetical protein [Bradyrhizobium]UGA48819.1 hypothetical protein HU230_0041365 [Bradyrhizobium quebecense]UGY00665.1 hypothetical protein J4P68_0026445 [Bradyrhizobium quebecense]UPT88815.1 hypothetical protein HAP41_0000007330 [Bradyrhizobium barranii subsp. apii]UPT96114.1 hypothetical protein J4G48_0044955 [Bradyrhizobium barranii subsp. apii]